MATDSGMVSAASSQKGSAPGGDVKVLCRVRPQNQMEMSKSGQLCVAMTENTIEVGAEDSSPVFTFDRVFNADSKQQEVFEYTALPMVQDVLTGYNSTIFAYGQTSSGKTHTMEGPNIYDAELRGLIPRTVAALFEGVLDAPSHIEFTVKISYIEIYMEKIRDLLDEFRAKGNLQVREDPQKGIYVAGATEKYVTSEDELLDVMSLGKTNRAVAATGMNEGSSRSHSVFIITVQQRDLEVNSSKSGMLYLVDLAGSEMVRKTHASGQQLEEAKTINKSLSALGQVINALTDERQSHIPYRDSKLTRVLQNSLGGNCKTALVICVSPSTFNAAETLSTCRFGARAKRIQNKAVVNEVRSVEELTALLQKAESAIDMQQSYIVALESQLQQYQASGAAPQATGEASGTTPAATPRPLSDDAARVITQLQEKIAQLEGELEEEKMESRRREEEEERLTIILKEKERLLAEAGELMKEAERHCEAQRDRAEAFVTEKADAVAERDALRQQIQELVERNQFDMGELRLNLEKMQAENRSLIEEITELTGDAPQASRRIEGSPRMDPRDALRAESPVPRMAHTRQSSINDLPPTPGRSTSAMRERPGERLDESVPRHNEALTAEALEALEKAMDEVDMPEEAREFVKQREQLFESERNAVMERVTVLQGHVSRIREDYERKLRDIETQRQRLTADLSNRVQKVEELEQLIEAAKDDPSKGAEALSDKQRQHMKSLQQRLEQLVAVHRQLLRKFASLELENSDFRKKIVLRDERIKQLETNAKILAANMRAQAERHVAELTKLREQVSVLREEQMQQRQMESKLFTEPVHRLPGSEVRAIRGGGGHQDSQQVRAIRGGGLGGTKTGGRASYTSSRNEKSFLSRLFTGNKS
mmetsp:Transcript_38576/g.48723  ORF Transcript_38576/g.48723 Transcript_38576/m.48723 type:complete len:883 (-) Transcript_38576:359-3007(-)|eukprot:CAMPEP_0117759056 /NCGR_PEP_ID=MMETSP0947-20121206/15777_1 /TAXON_ID=44440 /ORGANISM="Chattonella subsalsa, Strain CCMP2191" /LENGTH=882 /DNA_ID=CAMNT_0005579423 /DNA_START=228 /DNA_END=2876 /DNA_ORIENTATION=+